MELLSSGSNSHGVSYSRLFSSYNIFLLTYLLQPYQESKWNSFLWCLILDLFLQTAQKDIRSPHNLPKIIMKKWFTTLFWDYCRKYFLNYITAMCEISERENRGNHIELASNLCRTHSLTACAMHPMTVTVDLPFMNNQFLTWSSYVSFKNRKYRTKNLESGSGIFTSYQW